MKTTKRILIAALSIFTLMVIAGCSSKRNEGNKTGIDSTHTREYIAKISLQEPERALAIIDTMEMNNEERPYAINYLRFVVYNNGLADYKMADYYGKLVLKDSIELKQDCKRYYSLLNTLASIANSNSQFAQSIIEHFGIQAEEYRRWSKNMSKQDKTNIEEAKQMKDSFIRNMSHEIRTPLNQIFGFVQLLTDPNIQLSDEEKRQYNDIVTLRENTHISKNQNIKDKTL